MSKADQELKEKVEKKLARVFAPAAAEQARNSLASFRIPAILFVYLFISAAAPEVEAKEEPLSRTNQSISSNSYSSMLASIKAGCNKEKF